MAYTTDLFFIEINFLSEAAWQESILEQMVFVVA